MSERPAFLAPAYRVMSAVPGKSVVGRERELAEVERLLEPADRMRVLLLEGEPGVGKTTVWEAGVARAREHGFRVLQAQPAAAERELSFATLSDLLEPVIGTADDLPRPRRAALDAALQRSEAPASSDAIALGLAVRAMLVSPEQPTLLAIDDVQWVDAESARTLTFALRRPAEPPPVVLATVRTEAAASSSLLEEAVAPAALSRLPLGCYSLDELALIVHEWLDAPIPRPQLVRLWEASGGNAFFARELLRAGRDKTGSGEAFVLPLTPTLETLVASRLQLASRRTQQAVAAVAALARPTVPLVSEATGAGSAQIDEAIDLDLLVLAGERLSVAHPLLASAAYYALTPARRRALHQRLAEVCPSPEERALHLAAATAVPSEPVAASLEDAAVAAERRGAPSAAATLLEHATRLTPTDERRARDRRRLQQAVQRLAAGDGAGARSRLEALVDELEPGSERAEALCWLADARWDDLSAMTELCERAAREAADDGTRARAHLKLGEILVSRGDFHRAAREASTALELADRSGDELGLALALANRALADFLLGRGVDEASMARALTLEEELGTRLPIYQAPSTQFGVALIYIGDADRADEMIRRQLEQAEQRGDEPARSGLLLHSACLAHRRGDLSSVEHYGIEIQELDAQLGHPQGEAYGRLARLFACAELGREQEARAHGAHVLAYATPAGDNLIRVAALSQLAALELAKADFAAAWTLLEGVPDELREWGWREPAVHPVHAPAIEALVGIGELERATELTEELETLAQQLGRPTALATAARCRGLTAAGAGDTDAALDHFERAVRLHSPTDWPLERARTLLVHGAALRRARQWRAARESLLAARATFAELDAALWVARTDAELKRIAGRTAATGLTPTETRVAQLIAAGRSNKEAAAELFVTVRTIESNLSRIYAKLGIRSRTELAARLHEDESGPAASVQL